MSKIIKHVRNVPIYDGDVVYLNDWLMVYHGMTEEQIKDNMLFNNLSQEEIDEKIEQIKDDFYDWCEDHNMSGFEV